MFSLLCIIPLMILFCLGKEGEDVSEREGNIHFEMTAKPLDEQHPTLKIISKVQDDTSFTII